MLLRFRDGVDAEAALNRVSAEAGPPGAYAVAAAQKSTDRVNFGPAQSLPLILGVLVALTLADLLVPSIDRRRRDLAVLEAIGLTSWQLRHRTPHQPRARPPRRPHPVRRTLAGRLRLHD
jgi:hypothetical protein